MSFYRNDYAVHLPMALTIFEGQFIEQYYIRVRIGVLLGLVSGVLIGNNTGDRCRICR